ncbi:hypothetical protein AWH62_00980 [Maricaulis sp. W15]|uniref:Uncharacterized protein n=1 Tax=Maricaulis maris TaxID=74318 RepID=A0A495DLQ1_9PROT|nr:MULTISPECIES: hypothetical protein [Maricaulis]OLF81280.1 hypothetical protein AWH62_00980 [Maricaulis sp. W15]RKR03570.1 hypothetical protein C7435_0006 [Maricaulis maris]
MLTRLQAEETLRSVQAQALGSGLLEKGDFHRSIARLERAAYGRPVRAAQASPAALQAMGIGVTVVPPVQGAKEAHDG